MFGKKKRVLVTAGAGDLNSMVELTLLDPRANEKDVFSLCNIAYKNRFVGVVVFPMYVKMAKDFISKKLDDAIKVIAAIDFPFGGGEASLVVAAAKKAFSDGADEVDVCVNTGKVKDGNFKDIKTCFSRIVRASKGKIVKATIEASFLNREELSSIMRFLIKAKVDFVMTNTGFGDGGATPEIVETLNAMGKGKVKVKASGGVTNRIIANDCVRMGAERIGTSRVI